MLDCCCCSPPSLLMVSPLPSSLLPAIFRPFHPRRRAFLPPSTAFWRFTIRHSVLGSSKWVSCVVVDEENVAAGVTKGMTEGRVIGGVGGSGTVLVLFQLLLRYEGGGPRLSRRIGGLPYPAGCTGRGRAHLVRIVVTKRSARALLTVVGGRGERTVHLLRFERDAPSSAD